VSSPAQAGDPVVTDIVGDAAVQYIALRGYWMPRFRGA
jgi:hypothetical protein